MSDPLDQPRKALLTLAQECGVSLAGLSQLIGRNPSYLQQFVRKGSPRRLAEDDRVKLAQFFGVDERDLGGLRENSYAPSRGGGFVDIPRLSVQASAGPGAIAAEEKGYDTLQFSRRWLAEQGFEPAQLSVITVEGDSMEPLLSDRDEILVDRSPRAFSEGIHVVRLGDSLMVKRVANAGAGRFALLSENPSYPPLEIAADDIALVGRVVWKGGRV